MFLANEASFPQVSIGVASATSNIWFILMLPAHRSKSSMVGGEYVSVSTQKSWPEEAAIASEQALLDRSLKQQSLYQTFPQSGDYERQSRSRSIKPSVKILIKSLMKIWSDGWNCQLRHAAVSSFFAFRLFRHSTTSCRSRSPMFCNKKQAVAALTALTGQC